MACLKPLVAIRRFEPKYDRKSSIHVLGSNVDYNLHDLELKYGSENVFTLPCSSCFGCKLDHASEWATRCMLESYEFSENCFLTLDYDPQHFPITLVKRDLQLFFKRLRKALDYKKIRYLACGEYGEKTGRAHYHCIIFGFFPSDAHALGNPSKGNCYYSSEFLNNVWKKGSVLVGNVSYGSCKYVAGYVDKKLNAVPPYPNLLPPFIVMSNRPGIGANYFKTHAHHIYDYDCIVLDNGQVVSPPRYSDKIADQLFIDLSDVKAQRKLKQRIDSNNLMQIHGFEHREELLLANSYNMKNKLSYRRKRL